MSEKMQHCFNCGESLGVYQGYYGDRETCSDPECGKAAREAERDDYAARQESAAWDHYERYGY